MRAELNRILASDLFTRSERLSGFLKFIVERTLNGRGDSLKEHVIAVERYGRDITVDTAADPIVRVDARRLRDKLREYYSTAPPGDIVISVPKGAYTPVFLDEAAESAQPSDSIAPPQQIAAATSSSMVVRPARRWWAAGATVACLARPADRARG